MHEKTGRCQSESRAGQTFRSSRGILADLRVGLTHKILPAALLPGDSVFRVLQPRLSAMLPSMPRRLELLSLLPWCLSLLASVGSSATHPLDFPAATPRPDFTIVAVPDTQYYVSSLHGGNPAMFLAQTDWILSNRPIRNIAFVTQLGDCVENGDNGGDDLEWRHATNALYRLETPVVPLLPFGLPYGVAVGNHDQSPIGNPLGTTAFYNQYFGVNHFAGRTYYAGHYGADNDNHCEFFSAGGLDFMIVHLEYDVAANASVLGWANSLLQTHSNRLAIVVSHWLIGTGDPGAWGAQGQATYNALKGNANLRLMLCGHVPGEGRRADTFNGRTVHTLLSDYQGRSNGGDGWLRILEFSPSNNVIRVSTYSPVLGRFETDSDSQFTLPFDLRLPSPPCATPPAGLVNWWRAEGDAEGTVEGNPGETIGGLGFDLAHTGRGFRFNGMDAGIRIAAAPNLNVGVGPGLTLEAWVCAGSVAAPACLIEWNDGAGQPGVSLWLSRDDSLGGNGPGSVMADLTDTSGRSHLLSSPGGLVVPNRFHHLALSYDQASGAAALSVDGVSAAQANLGSFIPQTTFDLHLGSRPVGSTRASPFSGMMDELSLYARALTPVEISAIVAADVVGKCIPPPVPVSFVTQPQNQTVVQGDNVSFRVKVKGTGPFGYRWRRNGGTLVSFDLGTSTLELPNIQTNQAGTYSVVVTNAVGLPGALSQNAVLTVLVDTDGDHLPDTWERDNALDPDDPADAALDRDGDGMSALAEYLAGTDPRDPASNLVITTIGAANTDLRVRFTTRAGKSYRLERADDVDGAPAWLAVVGSEEVAGTGGLVERVDTGAALKSKRLYRVRLLPGASRTGW